jgi:Leucine-rich repeat (LRR) protein
MQFFKSYRAPNCLISRLDVQLRKFENLQILNLSNNHISKIENLPHNLKELSLTNNHIDEIEVLRSAHLSLIALGLSYNQIKNSDLVSICKNFPNLFCLDVSFNQLDDFRSSISWVEGLEKLKMFYI